MEEAFRLGALNHFLANGKGIYAPLVPAAAWAKASHFRQLYVTLLSLTAEDNIILSQTQKAEALLDEARGAIGNRMAYSRVSARRAFLQATALYQEHQDRKTTEGDAVLAKVMPFLRNSSIRLFQIQKADDYYTGGGKGGVNPAREALDLYKDVLRDPQPIDWMSDPMESLAMLSVPHELPFEHWFTAAVARKDHELAMEVADRRGGTASSRRSRSAAGWNRSAGSWSAEGTPAAAGHAPAPGPARHATRSSNRCTIRPTCSVWRLPRCRSRRTTPRKRRSWARR